jgi:chromosome segregation ATPase
MNNAQVHAMNKRSVTFSDEVECIPEDILEPYFRAFCPDTDPFCRSLGVADLKLLRCALSIQGFIRDNILHWRHFNEERSRILEQLDDVAVMKKGELERVEHFRTEMKREVEMDINLTMDDQQAEEHPEVMRQVEEQKLQVKELETENAQLKQQAEDTRKDNKNLAMATFKLYESFAAAVSDLKAYEAETHRLQEIRNKYAECCKNLKGLMKILKADMKKELKERAQLETCIDGIVSLLEERYSKKKLIGKVTNMKLDVESQVGLISNPIEAT